MNPLQRDTGRIQGDNELYGGQDNAPLPAPNVHTLIPRIRDCVVIHGKRDVANGVKIAGLQIGNCLGFSERAQSNHMGP